MNWNSNVPEYIQDEPLPDGDPEDYLDHPPAAPTPGDLVTRSIHEPVNNWALPSCKGKIGSPADPIANFGKKAAQIVLNRVNAAPIKQRAATLRTILESADKGLHDSVMRKAVDNAKRGLATGPALERAIASSFANHYVSRLVDIGKGRERSEDTLAGLGSTDGLASAHRAAEVLAMGDVSLQKQLSSLTFFMNAPSESYSAPVTRAATKAEIAMIAELAAQMKRFAKKMDPGKAFDVQQRLKGAGDKWYFARFKNPAMGNATWVKIWKPGKTPQVKIRSAPEDDLISAGKHVADAAKTVLNKLGDLACTLNNVAGEWAAGAAGAVGGPPAATAAGAGQAIVASKCAGGGPVPPPMPPPPASSSLVLPIVIGGAALAAVLMLK